VIVIVVLMVVFWVSVNHKHQDCTVYGTWVGDGWMVILLNCSSVILASIVLRCYCTGSSFTVKMTTLFFCLMFVPSLPLPRVIMRDIHIL